MKIKIISILFFFILISHSQAKIGDVYYCQSINISSVSETGSKEFKNENFTIKLFSEYLLIKNDNYFKNNDIKIPADTSLSAKEYFSAGIPGFLNLLFNNGQLTMSIFTNTTAENNDIDELNVSAFLAKCDSFG